ncbi:hypothetical protein MUK42_32554 [Musa troglodytarum]|uniref:Uncharacterized protein n=2 Tax=Musa troglodytarum TaxID=320322 RepID=A0A9E7KFX3_9LILI|nr:hypothetical protein MUK42_32554 [Musa troglodytarum]
MEVERARLLSLALEFGFDEDAATRCLDRLLDLYGEDGRDFVTVEHCGDDFLAALADSIQDKEDWDDLQAIESEACGALNDIFVNTIPNNEEAGNAIVLETRDLGKRNSLRDPDHENIGSRINDVPLSSSPPVSPSSAPPQTLRIRRTPRKGRRDSEPRISFAYFTRDSR